MQNATLGLRSVFKSITDKILLRQLFERYAPSATITWETPRADLPDELFRACGELRRKAKPEHENLICALQEVCDICADAHTPERLVNGLQDAGLLKRFKAEVKSGRRELQNAAVWLLLNAPGVWSHLVVASKAIHIHAKTWDEFKVLPCNRPSPECVSPLGTAIATYLVKETLHGEHVHIELDQDGDCFKYLVSVNNFPVNVQQFDRQGDYAVARDINALNFLLEYEHPSHLLRIKCPFDIKKRRDLVGIFATTVLRTEVVSAEKPLFDLSKHLETRVLPLATSPQIVTARQVGLMVSFRDARGKKETCTLTTQGGTNLQSRMQGCLELFGMAKSAATVEEVWYEIGLRNSKGNVKKVNARIAQDGFHFTCRDRGERQIVEDYLRKAVS